MDEQRFALTSPQLAIWLDQALHPQKPIYNTGQTLTIGTALDRMHFSAALRTVVAENDALRLRFSQLGSAIFQEIVQSVDDGLDVRDFSSERDAEAAAAEWVERTFWKPLTPADFPLFRFALVKVAERRFYWLQKYHHLIIDATGRQLVAARVAALYNALSRGEMRPAPGGSSYRVAKDAEDEYLASEQYAIDETYWTSRFGDVPEPLVRADPSLSEKSRSGRAARLNCALAGRDWQRLRAFAQGRRSSPFKVICGLAWSIFSRLYENPDLVFGVALANRSGIEAKGTVGLYSKVIPFRPRLDATMPFSAALQVLDADLAADLKHQRFPTDHINRAVQLRRLRSGGLFDAAINYVRNDYGFDLGGAPVTCSNLSAGFALPWSIMILEYGSDAIRVVIDYDHGRIASDEAASVFHALQELLVTVPDAADVAIGRLPVAFDAVRRTQAAPIAPPAPAGSSRQAASVPDGHPGDDDIRRAVVEIWRETFNGSSIDPDANFFHLGGDSLKAVFVVGECNARFGVDLPLTVLFERPTIAGLVDAIGSSSRETRSSRLVLLRPGGNGVPLLLVHPIGGTVFCYSPLVSRLPADRPVYGMQAAGLHAGEGLPGSIEEMAEGYVRAASAKLGDGPWHLAGWSFGGLIAFEMAVQLAAAGRQAASLTLIDTPARPVFEAEGGEHSVIAAVAGALGIDLASLVASGVAPSIPAIVSAAMSRPGAPVISEEQVERMAALVRNLRRLRHDYRSRKVAGSLLLLRAARDPLMPEDAFDWNGSATERVRAIAIPATHHSIVFPPHVDSVAAILAEVLAGAHGEERP